MSKRTSQVIISPEGRILKKLREKQGLSMRAVAEKLDLSDSYISQIENGRTNCPKGESLDRILKIYGGIGQKYFYEMCRDWEKESTDDDFIRDNVGKLSKDNLKLIKAMMTTMLASK
ncbi:MAG: helix-turn-helix transcriptional regulator [Pseudobdellovibrio sp.]